MHVTVTCTLIQVDDGTDFLMVSCVQLIIHCLCCCSRECVNKFGDEWGENVWNAVNDCFDAMPMAATVDGKVCTTVGF